MTARNRLRKRAAQKAKVTTFGVAKTRNQNTKTNKEPEGENNAFPDKRSTQVETNTSTANNNTGNGKSVDPDQAQTTITMNANSLIKTPTASTTVSVVPPQSCTIVCTAATIDPKSNQVQTVVVLPDREDEMSPEGMLVPSKEHGNWCICNLLYGPFFFNI